LPLIVWLCFGLAGARQAAAQGAAPAVQQMVGTVEATSASGFTLTTTSGQEVSVAVPASAKVLVVAPGSKDLSSATQGSLGDVAAGDRTLVSGTAGTQGITALRVILMKAQAIAAMQQAEAEAWRRGGGGIVKSVDAAAGKIMITSGMKAVTVLVLPKTVIRRYAPGSVRFGDARPSTIGEIQKGDQLLVRGAKSADGSTITADALVTGRFGNYSGLIASVDQQAGTISLKDLATKKMVTVAVTPASDLRSLPTMVAMQLAAQMRGAGHGGGRPAQGAQGAQGAQWRGGSPPPNGPGDQASARMSLSRMLSRLPTETLAGLKEGDAVMIVATMPGPGQPAAQAVTLLTGVEPILRASPKGQAMTLSPWSLGGSPEDEGGGEEGSQQ
jgi:Cu/Ag efflux protein CusF